MRKRNIRAIIIFLIFYVAFGVYLTLNQEKFAYYPLPQDFESCANFVTAEKVNYQGTRMYINLLEDRPTAVLYHGNAGSACDRKTYADIFSQAGYGYIIVEYAGFSNDMQAPAHALLKQNAEQVVSYLDINNISPVVVVGESIGTGVATHHVSLSPPHKLILISPFTDLKAVARNRFWFYPTSILVDNAFNNLANLTDSTVETLIIHGTEDDIIPFELGEELFQSLSAKKKIIPINGAGHNNLFLYEQTYSAINDFLAY